MILQETGKNIDELTRLQGAYGKPYFKELSLHFNMSHTEGFVACVIGKGEVGVDCERIRTYHPRLASRVCTENERKRLQENFPEEFFRLWTFKEAFVKFLGSGLRYPLQNVTLDEERSVFAVYPKLKILQTTLCGTVLCAMENGGTEINLSMVDLES
ncbi:MAG: 4'-phosphopantetheinyl transferase superfamily protein [Oscillospiraceae bacterium]